MTTKGGVYQQNLQRAYRGSPLGLKEIIELSDDPVVLTQPTANARVLRLKNTASGTDIPIIVGTTDPSVSSPGNYPKGAIYISAGTIVNLYIHNTAGSNTDWKKYQAFTQKIIDIAGQGDYTSVATAVSTEAANTLFFIRPGTYIETATIDIKSGQILIGANKNSVIIQLDGSEVLMTGGSAGNFGGTIAAGTTGTNVNGTGTTFTAATVGGFIIINDYAYTIATIISDTQLTVMETIRGNTGDLVGQDHDFMNTPLFAGNLVEQITFRIGTGTAFGWMSRIEGIINAVWRDVIFDGAFFGSEQGPMRFVAGYNVQFQNVRAINTTGAGLSLVNERSHNLRFLNCDFDNATLQGVNDTRGRNTLYDGCKMRNCGSPGLALSAEAEKATITNCVLNGNTGNNISITHGVSGRRVFHKIKGNQISFSAADGINISNVQHVMIEHNDIFDNAGNGAQITSTGSIDRISINNNKFFSNASAAIRNEQTGAKKFMYTNNQLDGNGADIVDSTTGAVNANNQI